MADNSTNLDEAVMEEGAQMLSFLTSGMYRVMVALSLGVFALCSLGLLVNHVFPTHFKMLLLNVNMAETLRWLTLFCLLFWYPATMEEGDSSSSGSQQVRDELCDMLLVLFEATGVQSFACVGLYTALVYLFQKFPRMDTKYHCILLGLGLVWSNFALSVATLQGHGLGEFGKSGFCVVNYHAPEFWNQHSPMLLQTLTWLCIVYVFTYASVKAARRKGIWHLSRVRAPLIVLLYLAASASVTFALNMIPGFGPFAAWRDGEGYPLLQNWYLPAVASLPCLLTPILNTYILSWVWSKEVRRVRRVAKPVIPPVPPPADQRTPILVRTHNKHPLSK